MAFPLNSSSAGLGSTGARAGAGDQASVNLALDNMIRNQLKVSDPRDPKQVASALLTYYQALPQAASIAQEAAGLPFLLAPQLPVPVAANAPTSSDREFTIAGGDVERALTDLSTSALTNDIIPEMQGWADAIRAAIADGSAAARQGLDPRMRDRVLGVRRQLSEYARLARFVGALYPGMTQNFRRLGQALDEVAAVLLVMLGEALASVGFASGYFLLQVPLSELQGRRDAVIYALRNFLGGAQQAYGPDDWPRGTSAYRLLFNRLEEQGQGDLRVLLVENEIARTMDELISRAQNGSAEGLRALGVTAQLDIERFRRLAIVAPGIAGAQNSPPLAAYLEALQLFADSFNPAGGLRILRIARPPVLFYGLYNTGASPIDLVLMNVISARGTIASLLDTLFLGGNPPSLASQVLFDMLTASLDRIIDLIAISAEGTAQDEAKMRRALAYWLAVRAILLVFDDTSPVPLPFGLTIDAQIGAEFPGASPDAAALRAERLRMQPIVRALIAVGGPLAAPMRALMASFPAPPYGPDPLRNGTGEELLVQRSLEKRWRELVRSVAPEAAGQDVAFNWLRIVVMQAFSVVGQIPPGGVVPPWDQPETGVAVFPPQYEQSLAVIAAKP